MKIYTRTGDAGTTALIGGTRTGKDDARLEAYGTVDELNSHLGLVAADAARELPDCAALLADIQSRLFDVGASLANPGTPAPLGAAAVEDIERGIDALEASLPPLTGFILPAGTHSACRCHVARTVCRRAERRVVALGRVADNVDPAVGRYLNRLSDYLFVLARAFNATAGKAETPWQPS